MTFAKNARLKLFRFAQKNKFDDPVSRRPINDDSREEELSAVLALRSQMGLVKWNRVNFWDIVPLNDVYRNARAKRTGKVVSSVFSEGCHMSTEYPLMTTKDKRTWIWGAMKADLVLFERRKVALIENKIGPGMTGWGDDPKRGQLALQAKYLDSLGPKLDKYLVLISGYEFFNKFWFTGEMHKLIEHRKSKERETIKFRLLVWEQIISPDWQPPDHA
jgi:hypothetical protein